MFLDYSGSGNILTPSHSWIKWCHQSISAWNLADRGKLRFRCFSVLVVSISLLWKLRPVRTTQIQMTVYFIDTSFSFLPRLWQDLSFNSSVISARSLLDEFAANPMSWVKQSIVSKIVWHTEEVGRGGGGLTVIKYKVIQIVDDIRGTHV